MMLHNSLLIFITSFKHKKSYQRVRPGKLAVDSNLLLGLTSLTPAMLADYIQQSRQSPAELQERSGVWGGFCGVAWTER